MTLPLIIVNPSSAGGATGAGWARAAGDVREHFGAFNCAFTRGAGDARVIAEREARAGRRLIVACGGDGTISEVASGILASGADAELGVLPSGTGGDFRRTLRMPRRTRDAARALRDGRTVRIDAGRVEFENETGGREVRHFVNVASCGMGGEVIRRAKGADETAPSARGANLLGGRASYAVASAQAALSFENPRLLVRLDGGRERHVVVTNLCVANARYFGGGMKIAPHAKLTDGLFDVVAVGDLGALSIFSNAHRLYLGTHLGMSQVHHARARKVGVRAAGGSGEKVLLEVDGELVGSLPATFEVLPAALVVRAPAQGS
ncbi:MAG TPA: diacylglycerol kinase family protein [Pyrinomonadaceae bacterium]|jgi:YegS/Rv2252/BmrU family lipid kinase|nr:diacylglycerol kinase family protein [Pyrinomonadaceae bacterium]